MGLEKPQFFKREEELPAGTAVIDAFESAVTELFFIRNPRLKKGMPEAAEPLADFLCSHRIQPVWIYYPWRNVAVRTVPEELYFELRTARNRNLIIQEEQKNYRNLTVGIAGLSVGSAVLSSLVASGGPKRIKIADPDHVEISNLNRIRASLLDAGLNKTTVAARNVWELDPFAELYISEKGVGKDTLEDFIGSDPRLGIFIDEMDALHLKFLAREICRAYKIPVLMATDNGDGVIVDVERFDQESGRPIFHGRIPEREISSMDDDQSIRMAVRIIDPAYLTERHQQSILNIGKGLSGVAQLGTAAAMAGVAVAYAARRIANKAELPSGRYIIGCEQVFIPGYNDGRQKKQRMARTKEFAQAFGISLITDNQ
jgi:molybdopterin/thiamine biosynthesis adenylyltransferase